MSVFNVLKIGKKLRGGIEGISHGVVFGWVVNKSAVDQPVRLQFLLDGVVIGTTQSLIVRADIAIAASSGYRCGFRFDLKPYLRDLAGQRLEIRDEVTGAILPKTPMNLDKNAGWGTIDGVFGIEVRGWAVWANLSSEMTPVEILIDGEVAGCIFTNQPRPDLRNAGVPHLKSGFCFSIPTRWHDGQSHTITARVKGEVRELSGGGIEFFCRVKGHIDAFSVNRVSGWIVNLESPECPIAFDLWVNGLCVKKGHVANISRHDVETTFFGGKACGHLLGFDIPLPQQLRWLGETNNVALCLPGTEENLLNSTVVAIDRFDLLEHVERFVVQLTADSSGDITTNKTTALNYALRTQIMPQIMPQIMSALRNASFDQPCLVRSDLCPAAGETPSINLPVDVIIPVYKGYQETMGCIRSVLASRNESPMEIVVINDHSPDAKLSVELKKLAAKEHFTLLENEKNLGFVATVNKGMGLHADRDVLLLNSDTIVPKGWLNAMRRAAYAAPNIGTVTPFSNRATIFSLPRTCFDNDMPLGMNVEQMNTLCAELNPGVIVDVPTAVGFCMYIRRETLNEVGVFDEERWDKGYCEENDFCIRAIGMGWRNVAACDVFVQHHGSVSFDTEKAPRVAENLAKLHAIYPDYPERIKRFLKADPMAVPRGRINMVLLKQLSPAYILFVTHGLGGGTETAIRNLCKLHAADGKKVLILRSAPSGKLLLAPVIPLHEKTLIAEYPHDTHVELLAEHLRGLNVGYVHFHHTLGFKPDIWSLPELLGVPYDVMIHDFYLVCPRINLIDESGIYCGQPEIAACERCIKRAPLDHDAEERLEEVGGTVAQWREFHMTQLQGARQVVTPSQNTRAHIQKYMPIQHIEAVPHPEPAFTFKPREWDGSLPHRIAVLGAIGSHKGSRLLLACAQYALRESLPLRFIVVGYTDCDDAFAELDNVEITGAYKPEELLSIVDDSGCTTALFLSVWPETFSYTLSEAWRLGLYPVVLDIGAPAERIREMQVGTIVPFTQNPRDILTALINVLDTQQPDYSSVLRMQAILAEPCESKNS